MALITAKKGTAMIAAALYGSEKQNFKRYWWPPGNAQSRYVEVYGETGPNVCMPRHQKSCAIFALMPWLNRADSAMTVCTLSCLSHD